MTTENKEELVCRDCGEEADPQFTIKLDAFDEEFHYCAICGAMAKEIEKQVNAMIGL